MISAQHTHSFEYNRLESAPQGSSRNKVTAMDDSFSAEPVESAPQGSSVNKVTAMDDSEPSWNKSGTRDTYTCYGWQMV